MAGGNVQIHPGARAMLRLSDEDGRDTKPKEGPILEGSFFIS